MFKTGITRPVLFLAKYEGRAGKMKRKSFWVYSLIGVVFTLIGAGAGSLVFDQAESYQYPAYREYLRDKAEYKRWHDENGANLNQREFEEVLSGTRPIEELKDPDLQEVAHVLKTLKTNSEADDVQRAESVLALFVTPEHDGRAIKWLKCDQFNHNCHFEKELSVLNEPRRLALILDGKAEAMSITIPEKFQNPPTYPKDAPIALPKPVWLPWVNWAVGSLLFALGFTLGGLGIFYWDEHSSERWSHPLKTVPHFVLGWLVFLAALPGFLAVQFVHLLVSDAGPAFLWTKGRVAKLRAKLRQLFIKNTFEDEYDEFVYKLGELQKRASETGDTALLQRVEEARKKVLVSKSSHQLAKLSVSLGDIDRSLKVMDEIERMEAPPVQNVRKIQQ